MATRQAADAAMPETAPTEAVEEQSTVDAPPEESPPPEWSNWRYVGDVDRIYTHVPVTVAHGDVIHHPGIPAADGNWEPTEDQPTKQRDNWRPDPADSDDTPKEA
jgi:hypothetical protein